MVFDPTKPAYRTEATSTELRDNFVGLAQHHRGSQAPAYAQLGWIWLDTDDSDNWRLKVYTRHGDGALSWKTLFDHAERTPFVGSDVEQQQVLYVGKHGADTNNGKSPGRAFLTFGAAITAAGAPADEANAVVIKGFDNGEYDEDLTIPSHVNIYAPRATIKGKQTFAGSTRITVSRFLNDTDTVPAILNKDTGSPSDVVFVDVGEIVHDGVDPLDHDIGVITIGTFYLRARRLVQTEGDGILVMATTADPVVLYLDIDEWDVGLANVTGWPTGLMLGRLGAGFGTATAYGRIGSMRGGTGSKCLELDNGALGGTAYLTVGVLTSPLNAYDARGAKLRLFVGELSGGIEHGDDRVMQARRDGTKAGVPGANDDENDGYILFSMVYDSNAGDMYVCCDPSSGAAVWKKITP